MDEFPSPTTFQMAELCNFQLVWKVRKPVSVGETTQQTTSL